MSFFDFIQGSAPTLGKAEVLRTCEQTLDRIEKFSLPATQAATDLWKNDSFKDSAVKKLATEIDSGVRTSTKRLTLFALQVYTLTNTALLLKSIIKHIDKTFNEKEISIGLTYAKATTLKLVQAADLTDKYTRRLINYIYAQEGKAAGADSASIPPAEIIWLNKNIDAYIASMNALQKPADEFELKLKRLPNAGISLRMRLLGLR